MTPKAAADSSFCRKALHHHQWNQSASCAFLRRLPSLSPTRGGVTESLRECGRLDKGRIRGIRREELPQCFAFERLLESPHTWERRRNRLGAISGHENERYLSPLQNAVDRISHLAAEIDVEDACVDRHALDCRKCFVNRPVGSHHV